MSQKVIVIGGGYGGVVAAQSLDKKLDVSLVAGGEVLRHTVAGIRASVLPETIPRVHIPYDGLLKRGTVHRCRASRINAEECTVTLATGEVLPYDFLILATGILHPKTVGVGGNNETVAEQSAVFKKAHSEVKAATNILVVGGGPVGIETAGEIKEEFPEKDVTLVTSKELMPSPTLPFSDRFRSRLLKKLEQVGVTVHTDCGRVDFDPEDIDTCGFIVGKRMFSWAGSAGSGGGGGGGGGGEAEADLCIIAAGARQTPSLYADSGLQEWLDDKGLLMVKNTFEVKGAASSGKVFALGDCADIPAPKMAYLAGAQGLVVAKQVAVSAAGKPLKDAMAAPLAVSLVPVGKSGGVSLLPLGIVVGDFITRTMKSRDLFVTKFWGELNAGKPPPQP